MEPGSEGVKDGPALQNTLDGNVRTLQSIFAGDETLVVRPLENRVGSPMRFCLLYIEGMVDDKLLDDDLVHPLLTYRFPPGGGSCADAIARQVTFANNVKKADKMGEVTQGIVSGDAVLLTDGCAEALILYCKGMETRGITEPESEKVLRGPHEGFNESLVTNLSMLRRRLRTSDLKVKFSVFGTRTNTQACICYLESLVNKNVLAELEKRLGEFEMDGVLDTNYIVESIRDGPYSPIKTIGTTERPDAVAAKLLEGRVALLLDGTPMAITMPYLFIENFQSSDDYYLNWLFASINRILRLLAFLISVSVPAIYASLVTFHQEMLPTPLLISVETARQGVPFPTALEAALMLIVFEMLREAGLRMPGNIGQALSIVGALVIGQAAVDARIISAPMVIIVGLTGITGLMVPRVKGAVILIRFILLGLSSMLGLYGYMFGMIALLVHLFNLVSFGIPIMSSAYAKDYQDEKDITARASWRRMNRRPRFFSADPVRRAPRGGGSDG